MPGGVAPATDSLAEIEGRSAAELSAMMLTMTDDQINAMLALTG
jgi:hypothetical protein